MEGMQLDKAKKQAVNQAAGRRAIDVDFEVLIDECKKKVGAALNHVSAT